MEYSSIFLATIYARTVGDEASRESYKWHKRLSRMGKEIWNGAGNSSWPLGDKALPLKDLLSTLLPQDSPKRLVELNCFVKMWVDGGEDETEVKDLIKKSIKDGTLEMPTLDWKVLRIGKPMTTFQVVPEYRIVEDNVIKLD